MELSDVNCHLDFSFVASCPESPYYNFLLVPELPLVTGVNFGSSCRIRHNFIDERLKSIIKTLNNKALNDGAEDYQ